MSICEIEGELKEYGILEYQSPWNVEYHNLYGMEYGILDVKIPCSGAEIQASLTMLQLLQALEESKTIPFLY
jgi:hypothetical protein